MISSSSEEPSSSSSHTSTNTVLDKELDAKPFISEAHGDSLQLHQFETQFVTNVYNEIAPHFSNTRYSRWPFINEFILGKKNCLFADVGCGNGKYMQSWKETIQYYNGHSLSKTSTSNCFIGTDISLGLAEICRDRDLEVLVANNTQLPFRGEYFDVVISVAVIHHFATPERRMQAIRELFRICRKGGDVLIYVWAFEQQSPKKKSSATTATTSSEESSSYRYAQQDVFVPWHLQKQFDSTTKKESHTEQQPQTSSSTNIVPNVTQGSEGEKVYKRYYHLFKKGELEQLVQDASVMVDENSGEQRTVFEFEFVKNLYFEKDNWGVVCRKK
ncbi:hypothetical protein C9374_012150 [Naegleria lovaniensis]|uniref:Methyltransferase type 11 domain-containing protein n=1 Tax=Naegleria lovaniensis TaxID=51637 RepID=A0AA88GG40_NAELO|nr:uncharacterized protein C9374_012150 [Naegleria lovaniensis]KAG2373411.1 hypothetical protein C9374_012150 [Naegleria lovaniensis]